MKGNSILFSSYSGRYIGDSPEGCSSSLHGESQPYQDEYSVYSKMVKRDIKRGVYKLGFGYSQNPTSQNLSTLVNGNYIGNKLLNKEVPYVITSKGEVIIGDRNGNGRMARLWQNVLLIRWNPVFEYLPLESQIKKYQEEYYQAIARCNVAGNSTVFVEFMLRMIDKTLEDFLSKAGQESISFHGELNRFLAMMEEGVPLSANEIMKKLRIKSKETLRKTYLNPALEYGLIKMTLPDKPHSKIKNILNNCYTSPFFLKIGVSIKDFSYLFADFAFTIIDKLGKENEGTPGGGINREVAAKPATPAKFIHGGIRTVFVIFPSDLHQVLVNGSFGSHPIRWGRFWVFFLFLKNAFQRFFAKDFIRKKRIGK